MGWLLCFAAIETLPAHNAKLLPRMQAGRMQDLRQHGIVSTWLTRQAKGLVEHFVVFHLRDVAVTHALVSQQQNRFLPGKEDQQAFFEARVVTGQVAKVGTMFAIAIDNEPSMPFAQCASQGDVNPPLVSSGRYGGLLLR